MSNELAASTVGRCPQETTTRKVLQYLLQLRFKRPWELPFSRICFSAMSAEPGDNVLTVPEQLIVPELTEDAEYVIDAGINQSCYTTGFSEVMRCCFRPCVLHRSTVDDF